MSQITNIDLEEYEQMIKEFENDLEVFAAADQQVVEISPLLKDQLTQIIKVTTDIQLRNDFKALQKNINAIASNVNANRVNIIKLIDRILKRLDALKEQQIAPLIKRLKRSLRNSAAYFSKSLTSIKKVKITPNTIRKADIGKCKGNWFVVEIDPYNSFKGLSAGPYDTRKQAISELYNLYPRETCMTVMTKDMYNLVKLREIQLE